MKIQGVHRHFSLSIAVFVFVLGLSLISQGCNALRPRQSFFAVGGTELTLQAVPQNPEEKVTPEIMQGAIDILRERIDPDGRKGITVQRLGEDRILVQLAGGEYDPNRVKIMTGATAVLRFIDAGSDPLPEGTQLRFIDVTTGMPIEMQGASGGEAPSVSRSADGEAVQDSTAGATDMVDITTDKIVLTGDDFARADVKFSQMGNPMISFEFKPEARQVFARYTSQHVSTYLAIALDDTIISCPVIREPILGGKGVIEGNFSKQETEDLVIMLNSGRLPVPLQIVENRSFSPLNCLKGSNPQSGSFIQLRFDNWDGAKDIPAFVRQVSDIVAKRAGKAPQVLASLSNGDQTSSGLLIEIRSEAGLLNNRDSGQAVYDGIRSAGGPFTVLEETEFATE